VRIDKVIKKSGGRYGGKEGLGGVKETVEETETKSPVIPNLQSDSNKHTNRQSNIIGNSLVQQFQKICVIGRGSFGSVYLVKKHDTEMIFAMKVIDKSRIADDKEIVHIKNEREVMIHNSHPFLMKLHYSFQTRTALYFVMDYINGGELFFHIKRGLRLNEDEVRFYSGQVVLALEYLHKHGIIYRDLKPENILLSHTGYLVLTDFGLSKTGLYAQNARTNTFCGTPEYMAPEVLRGESYTKSIDWWSLGTLMYELFCGTTPFYSTNVREMYARILSQTIGDTSRTNSCVSEYY